MGKGGSSGRSFMMCFTVSRCTRLRLIMVLLSWGRPFKFCSLLTLIAVFSTAGLSVLSANSFNKSSSSDMLLMSFFAERQCKPEMQELTYSCYLNFMSLNSLQQNIILTSIQLLQTKLELNL